MNLLLLGPACTSDLSLIPIPPESADPEKPEEPVTLEVPVDEILAICSPLGQESIPIDGSTGTYEEEWKEIMDFVESTYKSLAAQYLGIEDFDSFLAGATPVTGFALSQKFTDAYYASEDFGDRDHSDVSVKIFIATPGLNAENMANSVGNFETTDYWDVDEDPITYVWAFSYDFEKAFPESLPLAACGATHYISTYLDYSTDVLYFYVARDINDFEKAGLFLRFEIQKDLGANADYYVRAQYWVYQDGNELSAEIPWSAYAQSSNDNTTATETHITDSHIAISDTVEALARHLAYDPENHDSGEDEDESHVESLTGVFQCESHDDCKTWEITDLTQ